MSRFGGKCWDPPQTEPGGWGRAQDSRPGVGRRGGKAPLAGPGKGSARGLAVAYALRPRNRAVQLRTLMAESGLPAAAIVADSGPGLEAHVVVDDPVPSRGAPEGLRETDPEEGSRLRVPLAAAPGQRGEAKGGGRRCAAAGHHERQRRSAGRVRPPASGCQGVTSGCYVGVLRQGAAASCFRIE